MAQIFPPTLNSATSFPAALNGAPDPSGICSKCAISMKSGTPFSGGICSVSLDTRYLDRDFHIVFPLAGVNMSASTLRGRIVPSVRFVHDETHVARLAVGWQAEAREGFLSRIVSNPDLQHLTRLFGCGDRPPQLLGHADVALDHLNRGHALALRGVPEVVLNAGASMLPEGDADRSDRVAQTERSLVGEERAVWRPTDQLHQVEWICAADAATTDAEETVHRPLVVALANETLYEFESVDVREGEIRLDAVIDQALDVFEIEVRRRVSHKIGHRMEHRRVGETRSLKGFDRM